MRAYHTLRKKKYINDFEVFTMILSALEWRRHNGEIKLVTDKAGLDFVRDYGIENIWNEIEVSLDEMDNLPINENVFWAGAKILALAKQKSPCVMMDLDFIVWQKLDFSQYENELAVIHRESVNNDTYPQQDYFKVDKFQFDGEWDWSLLACNTAFAFFGNEELRRYYSKKALDFMTDVNIKEDYLCYMVFAEQRLLAMCAAQLGCKISSFTKLYDLFDTKQSVFTHIWGEKGRLQRDKQYNIDFCRKCLNRLQMDFPQWVRYLSNFEWFNKYLRM